MQDYLTEQFSLLAFLSLLWSLCNWGLSTVVPEKRLRMNIDNVIYNLYVLWRIKRLWKAVLQDICWFDSFSLTKIIIMRENEKNFNFKAIFYLLWLLSSKVLIFNILVLLDISNFVKFPLYAYQLHKEFFKYLHAIHLYLHQKDSFHLGILGVVNGTILWEENLQFKAIHFVKVWLLCIYILQIKGFTRRLNILFNRNWTRVTLAFGS